MRKFAAVLLSTGCLTILAVARSTLAVPTGVNSADVLDALQKLTYFEYARTPQSDAAEEGRLKDKLRDATGGAVGRADVDAMFDAADEKAFAAAWDRFRAALPDRDRWYVAAAVNPLPPAGLKPVTVAAGLVADRTTRTVTVDGHRTQINVVTLGSGCVRTRYTYQSELGMSDLLPPADVVIYENVRDSSTASWDALRHEATKDNVESERVAICRKDTGEAVTLWDEVAMEIGARAVSSFPSDDDVQVAVDNAAVLGAGRLSALRDADFVFAVNQAALSDDERGGMLLLRGAFNVVCDGEKPEMGLVACNTSAVCNDRGFQAKNAVHACSLNRTDTSEMRIVANG